ncbi:Pre-mRNA-processing factor 19 2 [Neolecta irregularis DAH-3]|uniref:Pre-mRNA-processing factor 19 n=1 Tax=Neolecta irregularis (strain DAH-3) TaxID=1198029 RepID=A0A1U7LIJ4_NEOID|nr:Pre-mRNA-processing factor 19 2 [Neolecta irregularis DAH-3]|eukprot:OLL22351.1 Pre-mRNA-processing factor 19 2 [Neolecta irregularis DAH-3]
MNCAISGEIPETPVVSKKSCNLFERRLLESYIAEHGKDPVSAEEMTVDDIIELKTSKIVRPRPPNLTSLPSLLSVFQTEWDALALETFTLKQQLNQTRQELSTALYQHDAACRVVARLMKERDEARDALSKISANFANGSLSAANNAKEGEKMDVDSQEGLPPFIVEKVNKTLEELSSARRKRKVPGDWATPEKVSEFSGTKITHRLISSHSRSIAVDDSGDRVVIAGKNPSIYSISENTTSKLVGHEGLVTAALWVAETAVTAGVDGTIRLWQDTTEKTQFSAHTGAVIAIASHPSGELIVSVGEDKAWAVHDVPSSATVAKFDTPYADLTCVKFHPDGHLLGIGTSDSQFRVFDIRSGKEARAFGPYSGKITAIDFSQNGYWAAASSSCEEAVRLWDLRNGSQVLTIEGGHGVVNSLCWDGSAQYLALAGSTGVKIMHYKKTTKEWSELASLNEKTGAIAWGPRAETLVVQHENGNLSVYA